MTPEALTQNPFFVLALPVSASRMEVERAGQRLLAQLAIGAESAKTYATPFGPFTRDENKVRAALAALRDPEQRVLHELWGAHPVGEPSAKAPYAWRGAWRSIGWRGAAREE